MDIRTKTGIIIRNDGKYLVGRILYSRQLRWSDSPYDAWITRNRDLKETLVAGIFLPKWPRVGWGSLGWVLPLLGLHPRALQKSFSSCFSFVLV